VDGRIIVGSPLGCLRIEASAEAIVAIRFLERGSPDRAPTSGVLAEAASQLSAYFAGRLRRFELPLEPHGTPFQQQVWNALAAIPFGVTWTYGQLAARIGCPKSSRAVGAANGANPIPVVLPCHRVIGADGGLTGYGGGIERKRALLDLEGVRRTGPRGAIIPLQMSLF
jgi:methylated-DNA-[protein]-cysteine S-methyltransferase